MNSQLPPQMPEPVGVHRPPIPNQLAQLPQPRLGEECPRPEPCRPNLDQSPVEHRLNRGRDLGVTLPLAAPPGAQENAIGDARILAEVAAKLAAEQVAFFGREGHAREGAAIPAPGKV